MTRRKLDHEHECPLEVALDVIGGKWKGTILHALLDGTARFNELRRLMPKATQRMVTLQLRELELDGVVRREVHPEVPPRVEYSLTESGLSLRPVLVLLKEWGEGYRERMARLRTPA